MISCAQANLRIAGELHRIRQVFADAGYWSTDNANIAGLDALTAQGGGAQLKEISEADAAGSELLARVEAGELDKAAAIDQLGVTRARLNQLGGALGMSRHSALGVLRRSHPSSRTPRRPAPRTRPGLSRERTPMGPTDRTGRLTRDQREPSWPGH